MRVGELLDLVDVLFQQRFKPTIRLHKLIWNFYLLHSLHIICDTYSTKMELHSSQSAEPRTAVWERQAKYFYVIAGMRLAIDMVKMGLIRLGQYTYSRYADNIYYNFQVYEISITVLLNAFVLAVFPLVNYLTCKYEMRLEDVRWKTTLLYIAYVVFGLLF